jgi:hypothetical protein
MEEAHLRWQDRRSEGAVPARTKRRALGRVESGQRSEERGRPRTQGRYSCGEDG